MSYGSSSFVGGGGGALTELIALGAMDTYLIKGATVTFFRFRYTRHTNFALEAVGQQFGSSPQFGGTSTITLNRSGDLIYFMYVVIDLPGIRACRDKRRRHCDCGDDSCGGCSSSSGSGYSSSSSSGGGYSSSCSGSGYSSSSDCDDSDGSSSSCSDEYSDSGSHCGDRHRPWCHYANAIGQHLVKRATLHVGGHLADTLWSDYLFMWEELSGKAGKRLREMIGKRRTEKELIRDSKRPQRLYVPLPFWFTQTSGNALPLCTLTFHGVTINIEWQNLNRCVVVSDECVRVVKCHDNTQLQPSDLQAWLDTTYVHLDVDERNRFADANFDQLITQVQIATVMSNGSQQINLPLSFNHPVIELIFAARRKVCEDANIWTNFAGVDGRDPISEVTLRLNNMQRFGGREGRYYRLVQPYQHHSHLPEAHVYCYSFALSPEDANPSGSLNMSRVDNVELQFMLQDALECEPVRIICFARNWQILRYEEGVAGILFHN